MTRKGIGRRAFLSFAASTAALGTSRAPAEAAAPTQVPDFLPPWAAAYSGAIQGVAQNIVKQLILHPFDTVKTRLQISPGQQSADSTTRGDLFRDVYRGLIPTLVSGTPGSATFFAAKEAATSLLLERGAAAPFPTLAGVVAGVLSAKAVKTPFDVAETKAMATFEKRGNETLAWDGSWDIIRETFAKDGLTGLYRGYGANVLYKLPADAAKFLAYEALRGSGAAGSLPPGIAGAAATLASNAVTTPLDVVRTRVMVADKSEGDSRRGEASTNALDMLRDLIASGDSTQIWSGLNWRLARGVAAGAIQFSVLEGTKEAIEKRR